MELDIATPRWAVPLLQPSRYKGAHGGRGSGKSHFFAERLVEDCVVNKNLRAVCIREVQKSIRFSSKQLIADKINALGVSHLFDIQRDLIKRVGGEGVILFQGMQDHTADSIKSLEGFDRAWIEEAQNISATSLRLLRPTIRGDDSEIWASWNPKSKDDAIDVFLRGELAPSNSIVVEVNVADNPFATQTLLDEYADDRRRAIKMQQAGDANAWNLFEWVWHGAYLEFSEAIIFSGRYVVDEFEPQPDWTEVYYGSDWGFAQDPTTLNRMFEHDNILYIRDEAHQVGCEIDHLPDLFDKVPGARTHEIRADNSRPETISYMKRQGFKIKAADKWPGSVEDGITFMKKYKQIVIHPDCPETAKEFKVYSYKVNKAGDVLPEILDLHNHHMDGIRYGLQPLIRNRKRQAPATGGTRTF
ncbi:PBSX family phage terminase large subunit [Alkanindiges illinoisensis]|uniref:PBSX family phage terminase large subunit n=1 Tax=Alkanindiges illinoisensis TaxID=197183 RepID=UPI00047BB58D|nr:phage terminase large subunit [Alkanindiges illinoisensis]